MSINTKAALLKELGKGSAVHGWGAILALGRDRLNTLLQDKFLERFSQMDFIAPISGMYYVDNDETEQVEFDELMFGPPSLSFEQASGLTGRVRVHMELIAGRCASWSVFPGQPKYLRRIHRLSQGLGYRLAFTVDVIVIPEGSGGRHLALDLRGASDPTCNLDSAAADRMGQFMLKQLLGQPAFAQPFAFLTLSPTANDAFTAIDVTPVVQRAPDGAGTGSAPETDGAILLLMHLQGTVQRGLIPAAMPYLLPRKVDAIAENTGAALLIGKLRAQINTKQDSRILSQLIMPGGHAIAIGERHQPHDMVCFGELKANSSMAWLSPGLSSIAAGERVEFTSNGIQMHDWKARDVNTPRSAGTISEQGAYRARSIEESGSAQRVTVVTAKVSRAADAKTRAALVVESAEPFTVSPRVVTWYPGYENVPLRASGGSGLTWKLLGVPMGVIEPDPKDSRRATFKPTPQNTPFVRLQRIEVSNGESTGHAMVVLLGVGHTLEVQPFPVPRISPGGQYTFNLLDHIPAAWQVFGVGKIDSTTGTYTAPAQTNEEASVVVAFAGGFAGVAVIEHQVAAPVRAMALNERWSELSEFSLNLNNPNRMEVYANGFGQVGIDIVIATQSFEDANGDTVWDPVSDQELATLALTDAKGNPIPYLTGDELGIPEDSVHRLMVSKRRHSIFDYYPIRGLPEKREYVFGKEEARREVTVYVHTRDAEIAKLRAIFQDHNRGWRSSYAMDDQKGEIIVEGIGMPDPDLKYFNWPAEGKRVAAVDGEDRPGDRFNFWHSTTDYRELSGNGITFADVKFDTNSMVKWESEQRDETFATYTGVAFKPRRPEEATEIPEGVNYQAELQLLANEPEVSYTGLDYNFKGQEEVTSGQIMVTLDRTSKLPFWNDRKDTNYREVLAESVKFTITDNYGNKHKLRLQFSGEKDPRNGLELKLQ